MAFCRIKVVQPFYKEPLFERMRICQNSYRRWQIFLFQKIYSLFSKANIHQKITNYLEICMERITSAINFYKMSFFGLVSS